MELVHIEGKGKVVFKSASWVYGLGLGVATGQQKKKKKRRFGAGDVNFHVGMLRWSYLEDI